MASIRTEMGATGVLEQKNDAPGSFQLLCRVVSGGVGRQEDGKGISRESS